MVGSEIELKNPMGTHSATIERSEASKPAYNLERNARGADSINVTKGYEVVRI